MWWTNFLFCLSILIILIIVWFYKRRKRINIFKRCKIPGPEPSFFSGNLKEYKKLSNVLFDQQMISRYGKICGYFLGMKPIILTSDLELLKLIQTSPHFLERPRKVPGGISPDPKRKFMLGNLSVADWEEMRRIMSPAFTSGNLKSMIYSFELKMNIFLKKVDHLVSVDGKSLDFYPLFQDLTLDIIGLTAFGLDWNIQNNRNEKLDSAIKSEFSKNTNNRLTEIYLCNPEFTKVFRPIREIQFKIKNKLGWIESSALWDVARTTVKASRQNRNPELKKDLLRLLLTNNAGLSDDQIVANTALIFEAAYETTSSCLAFTVHLLIHHPEWQVKIRNEIEEAVGNGGLESAEVLQSLKNLEACILESLRLYSPQTTFIGRCADRDVPFIKNGELICTIPKGVHIQAALVQIHQDEANWMNVLGKNPHDFVPERFIGIDNRLSSEYFYQAFGKGKRQCIGKGFAMLSIKYILARLLSQYQIFPCENGKTENEKEIEITYKTATMTPTNGCYAKVVPV